MKIKFHVDFFEFVPSHIRISMVVVVFRTIFFPLPSIFARSLARLLALPFTSPPSVACLVSLVSH